MTAARPPGLQPERTELAWRRTLLALAAGSLVSVRVLPPVLGVWTIATGAGGVALAGLLQLLAERRNRLVGAVFRGEREQSAMPGGVLLLALAACTAAGAALGLGYALLLAR